MKKIYPNLLTLFLLFILFIFYTPHSDTLSYWGLLTHNLVLNVGIAAVALVAGYWIKNYYLLIFGLTFSLAIYTLVLISTPESDVLIQFFLAIYTVVLAFSVVSNLARHYKDWILLNTK